MFLDSLAIIGRKPIITAMMLKKHPIMPESKINLAIKKVTIEKIIPTP